MSDQLSKSQISLSNSTETQDQKLDSIKKEWIVSPEGKRVLRELLKQKDDVGKE